MKKTIRSSQFTADISTHGAELCSIRDGQGNEYLWQGDKHTWEDHAPVLFPYIGRFTEGLYSYRGKKYSMQIHGLALYSEFEVTEESGSKITFRLTDTEESRKQYPFPFCFEVTYQWKENSLEVCYRVENTGEETLYFAVGGHPGFCVPFEEGTAFEDYRIEFESGRNPKKIELSDDCFILRQQPENPERVANPLPLRHSLFDRDAIVMEEAGERVTLCSGKSGKSITVEFPDMPYLGIWHWPKTEVPYVCLEPWSSLPSRKGIVEELETKPDLLSLKAGKAYENHWRILFQV